MSWTNQLVRHADGRLGRIRESTSFVYTELQITAEDGVHEVVLNACGSDHGDSDWYWFCADFSGGPHWCPLGDHWAHPKATACTPEEIAAMAQLKAEQPWRNWPTQRATTTSAPV
jgi:hypothetical protein